MRFAVFTHVEHQYREGKYFAYAPYVREMNLWFQYVGSVEVVAPLTEIKGTPGDLSYEHLEFAFTEIPSFNFLSLKEALFAIFKIPIIIITILGAMKRADHLHIRCPGNIGLLACICQVFFPRKPKTAKYAGNWDPKARQPWSYKLQKWVLQNTFLTKNMKVLVYGDWPGKSKNLNPFYTASFSEKVILRLQEKSFVEPYIFLFVGNLVPGKGLKIALKMIQRLKVKGVECRMEIYGDGPERTPMEAYVSEAGLKEIHFKGNQNLEELELAYQKAHFLILPSKSEGWPKAVAEGMFFGCIPIVTPVSCVPWMLGKESGEWKEERGILIEDRGQRAEDRNSAVRGQRTEDRNLEENVERILEVLGDEERMQRIFKAAREWSQEYTLERFEAGIREVLENTRKPSTRSSTG